MSPPGCLQFESSVIVKDPGVWVSGVVENKEQSNLAGGGPVVEVGTRVEPEVEAQEISTVLDTPKIPHSGCISSGWKREKKPLIAEEKASPC